MAEPGSTRFLKLAEARVDFVRQFLVAFMLRRQAVELGLHEASRAA